MAFDYDVVIVGGGPAGASTSLHLGRTQGIRADRVALLDKAKFPRDKPCAGAVSQLGIDALRAVGVTITVPHVPMCGVRVLMNGAVGETSCAMGIVVRRLAFDAQLLDHARTLGVHVRDGEALSGIRRVPGGFQLTTSKGIVTTRLLAVSDGAGGPTRKLLGISEPARKGHLYVLDTAALATDTGVARGFADFDLSILEDGLQGYYWDFPTVINGHPSVSRGIYHANLSPSSDLKRALGRALALRGVDIEKTKLRPFSTRPFVASSTLALEGALLVGESAGIDQATGEGIAQAIVMGAIAARHVARALRTGLRSFYGYAEEVRSSRMGRHMLQSAWLANRVYGPWGGPARRLLLTSSYARAAGMSWYNGQSLPWSTKARLGAGLVLAI